METIKNINIGVSKIEVRSFSMTSQALKFTPDRKFLVDLSLTFNTPSEDKIFNFIVDINVLTDDDRKDKLANLKINNSFHVANINDFTFPPKIPGGAPEIDGSLVAYCLEASMGHARGIWSVKTEGTPLEPVALPLVPTGVLMEHMKTMAEQNRAKNL